MSETMQQRVLKWIGESGLWKPTGRIHAWLYRLTGGWIGHRAGHITNLLLTTIGRKTGQPRTVTLTYMPDGANFILVASNGGADQHPVWWLNLQKNPQAEVQIGKRKIAVAAINPDLNERARLWKRLKAYNPFYAQYEKITDRRIPVIVLEPQTT